MFGAYAFTLAGPAISNYAQFSCWTRPVSVRSEGAFVCLVVGGEGGSVSTAVFHVNLGQPVLLGYLPPLVPEESLLGKVAQIFGCPFCDPSNSVEALKETPSTDHRPVAWPYPFFIHCQTPEGRGVGPFMPILCNYAVK